LAPFREPYGSPTAQICSPGATALPSAPSTRKQLTVEKCLLFETISVNLPAVCILLRRLPITPQPQNNERSNDCREVIGERERDQSHNRSELKSNEGTCNADESHGKIACTRSKPAAAIAIDDQAGYDANNDNNTSV
jgi:hypothetical protein